jgi:2-oxoglutarate ferredoxin oxidoreductase subunit alpha
MKDYSVLMGGQAGDGIRQAGGLVARMLSRLGYHVYFWDDYPSLIRGGHNFSVIRACERRIEAYRDTVDILVCLNEDTVQKHKPQLKEGGLIVYDSDVVKAEGCGVGLTGIVKEAGGKPVMRNIAALGAVARSLGIEWPILKEVVELGAPKATELNLKIAKAAFDAACDIESRVERLEGASLPLVQGNEAIALGAARAGLNLYVAYPMTPSSSILHFLARHEEELGLVTYHPENEISAVVTAIGGAYAGARTMVATSGGGFALMTEGLSLCAQSEAPVVFAVSQRPGPSTGVPTYTSQGDLFFILSAGQGEFLRFVVAPGDPDQAFRLTGLAMNTAWKYQIPALVVSDKNLSESTYCFGSGGDEVTRLEGALFGGGTDYKRYLRTDDGISPLAFPGTKGIVVKGTSYEHDEHGITTEVPEEVTAMQNKRLAKGPILAREVDGMDAVAVFGNKAAPVALLTWGSTKGACAEVAEEMGLRVVQPMVMEPLPLRALTGALEGAEKVIAVENNATGLLARLVSCHGVRVDRKILKYDGRPFSVDGLRKRVEEEVAK